MINLNSVVKMAYRETPVLEVISKKGWYRHDVASLLSEDNNTGVELGVAKGTYSKRMLDTGRFKRFFGVDVYGDTHDTKEYCDTLNYIGIKDTRYTLLRMDFDSAVRLFDDNSLDFVYIDGFAHAGEEGGKTLIDWYPKLKAGGVMAGDDYHSHWPLVIWAVNDFVSKIKGTLYVTTETEDDNFSRYPTWFFVKDNETLKPTLNPLLYKVAMREKKRIQRYRVGLLGSLISKTESKLKILKLGSFAYRFFDILRKFR